jgi:hypothetical protein
MTMQYRAAFWSVCALAIIFMVGCHHFPDDFPSQPLDKKISTYEQWIAEVGRPSREARLWISWHGISAANAMVPYVLGQKNGIPRYEALWIISAVQSRGCSLRDTPAELAVSNYIKSSPSSKLDAELAESTLMSIETEGHVDKFDSLPTGPCNAKRTGDTGPSPAGGPGLTGLK